jgi:hypothetical protein
MKILQVFNSYLQFGGEEAAVDEIGEALRRHDEVDDFCGSSGELLGRNWIDKVQAPFKAIWNLKAFEKLRRHHRC